MRIAFCVSGAGRLALTALRHGRALGIRESLLVAEGKADPGLGSACAAFGATCVRIDEPDRAEFDRRLDATLLDWNADLTLLTFDRLVDATLVDGLRGRLVNVHMALLPSFPGFSAVRRAVSGGVRLAGTTMHFVDRTMDGGPILAQSVVTVRPDDTPDELGRRLYQGLAPMYLQVVRWFAEGRVLLDASNRVQVERAVYTGLPTCPEVEPLVASLVGSAGL